MASPLDPAARKIVRAQEHLGSLEQLAADALVADYGDFVVDFESQMSRYVVRYEVSERRLQNRIALVVGDLVHNLRCALDYLVWELVIANGGTPDRFTQFPIYDDALSEKGKVRSLEISGGVSFKALALIEAAQPYQRSDSPTLHPLWLLQNLSNIDKHRSLNVVAVVITDPQMFLSFPSGTVLGQFQVERGQLEGAPIAFFPITGTPDEPANVDVEVTHSQFVTLGDFDALRGEPINKVCRDLTDYVALLINCIASDCFP